MEGTRVAILGYGTMVQSCLAAAKLLQNVGISATVADARFCKPLDGDLIKRLAQEHEVLVTVEEGSIGGFGSHVSHFFAMNDILNTKLKVIIYKKISSLTINISEIIIVYIMLQWRPMMLPDKYIEHGAQKDQIAEAGLTPKDIADTVLWMIEGKQSYHF